MEESKDGQPSDYEPDGGRFESLLHGECKLIMLVAASTRQGSMPLVPRRNHLRPTSPGAVLPRQGGIASEFWLPFDFRFDSTKLTHAWAAHQRPKARPAEAGGGSDDRES